ncbi:exonuclease domain-containing protein [Methylobacterium sp. NPDC080182]|uniref:exonuclease domain-containing protein n=1 Tax=Methylobacterium sp. NPDC080182 TaxID=3390590 RepID=UPI003D0531A0
MVFDAETLSIDANVDRIVEVGGVELVSHALIGSTFHRYSNPQMAVHLDAFVVHGLTNAFLTDKLLFAAIVPELLVFIGDAALGLPQRAV